MTAKTHDPEHADLTDAERIALYRGGCRGEHCRATNTARLREYRERREANGGEPVRGSALEKTDSDAPLRLAPSHDVLEADLGDLAGQDWMPAWSTSQRLRGLVFAGFPPAALSELLEVPEPDVWWLLFAGPHTRVIFDLHERVDRLHGRVAGEPRIAERRIDKRDRARAVGLARLQGWNSIGGAR